MSHSSSCNYQLVASPFVCLLDNGHLEDQTPLFDLLLANATHYESSSNYLPTLPGNMDSTYSLTPISTSPNLKGAASSDHHQHLGAARYKDAEVAQKKKSICLNDKHKEKTQGRKKKISNKVSDKDKANEEHTSACQGDCVYVRARNGQATDSHSLAERLRRQKIRDKMKLLQSLVPGCDKIVGKTLILDEIINYIHSLQSQVEFLMEKLACVDPALCANYLSVDLLSTPKEESCARTSLEYSTMLYECDQDDQASLYRMCAASSPSALTSAWLASLNDQDYYTI